MSRISGAAIGDIQLVTGDIEIGAVEIKNATDDTRATVGASGLYVDVQAIAAGDNNIGNVDIVSLPSGNLGQQLSASSLSVTPATDIADATYIGDIKFGEALPTGSNVIGAVTQSGTWNIGTLTSITNAVTVSATNLDIRDLTSADVVTVTGGAGQTADVKITLDNEAIVLGAGSASIGVLGANSGVDIGDVTINNGAGASAVNIQDGGNSITIDGTISVSGTVSVDSELTTDDLDTGVGTDTRAVVGIVGSASGGGQLIPGSATDGLLVNLGANNDVTVTGTITANAGTGTFIVGDAGAIINLDASGDVQVDVLSIAAGNNNIGDVDIASIAAGDNNIGNVDIVTMPNVTIGTMANLTESLVDDAAFTPATSRVIPIGATLDNTSPDSVDEGDIGALRMSANRNLFVTVRDAAGNERGLNVDASGNIGITDAGSTISIDDGAGNISVDWAGTAPPIGAGVEATALRVTIATDSTGLVSVDDNGGSLTIDNAALSVTGGGVEASALRVTIASDSTGVLSVDDNGGSLTIDGTVTANLSATDNAVLDAIDSNTDFGALFPTASTGWKYADINDAVSGDNTIIAAQGAGNKIAVWAILIVSDGTVDVRFEDGAAGTAFTGQVPLQAREGYTISGGMVPLFVGSANTLLNLELSAAVNVHGLVAYTVVT